MIMITKKPRCLAMPFRFHAPRRCSDDVLPCGTRAAVGTRCSHCAPVCFRFSPGVSCASRSPRENSFFPPHHPPRGPSARPGATANIFHRLLSRLFRKFTCVILTSRSIVQTGLLSIPAPFHHRVLSRNWAQCLKTPRSDKVDLPIILNRHDIPGGLFGGPSGTFRGSFRRDALWLGAFSVKSTRGLCCRSPSEGVPPALLCRMAHVRVQGLGLLFWKGSVKGRLLSI